MAFRSRMTSKGQVTVPIQIRRKLGLRYGDTVEFLELVGEAVIRSAAHHKSPFDKYIGILKGKHKVSANEWMAELRDDAEEAGALKTASDTNVLSAMLAGEPTAARCGAELEIGFATLTAENLRPSLR
jgi:antitoxin PrlF